MPLLPRLRRRRACRPLPQLRRQFQPPPDPAGGPAGQGAAIDQARAQGGGLRGRLIHDAVGPSRPLPEGEVQGASSTTRLVSWPTFSISTTISSPDFIQSGGSRRAPTPPGVPVTITSPGRSSVQSEQ